MPRKNDSKFWDDSLKLISFCPLCDTNYNSMEARVVGEDGNSHLLHITCKKCLSSVLALIFVSKSGVSSVGLVTDLNFRDVVKFRDSSEINADDVLDAHSLLEDENRFWKAF